MNAGFRLFLRSLKRIIFRIKSGVVKQCGKCEERLEKEVEKLRAELDETKAQTERDKSEIADVLIKADKLAKKLQEEAVMAANARKAEIEKQIISKKSELLGISGEIERMKGVFQDLYTRYVDK